MTDFFNEFYISQQEGIMNEYTSAHWAEALSFFNEEHERMDALIEVAIQCINSDNKEIYDNYVRNLLIEKGFV